jgi:CubicO group peptidase (beta-lactamase class C family)
MNKPLLYPPGTNWNYSHTNYVLLAPAMEKITGMDLATLLQEKVLGPLGLDNTGDNLGTPDIPQPVLHAFSSERRQALQIPASIPFSEESTFSESLLEPGPGRHSDHQPGRPGHDRREDQFRPAADAGVLRGADHHGSPGEDHHDPRLFILLPAEHRIQLRVRHGHHRQLA